MGSSCHGTELFIEQDKVCKANNVKPKASLISSEDIFSDAQHRVQVIELIKDIADQLATKVYTAKKAPAIFQKHV